MTSELMFAPASIDSIASRSDTEPLTAESSPCEVTTIVAARAAEAVAAQITTASVTATLRRPGGRGRRMSMTAIADVSSGRGAS
jgi:hypothetical protein